MPQIYAMAAGPWRATHPREARACLTAVTHRWWIAGGWALDLFLGAERPPPWGSRYRHPAARGPGCGGRHVQLRILRSKGWEALSPRERCAANGRPFPLGSTVWQRSVGPR